MSNISEYSLDILVRSLYKNYGLYINQYRQIPLLYDGLKPVERRVLLTTYEVAKTKFVKCNKIDGTCLANYHPHGGAYGTIVQLANQGFLEPQGNFGTDCGLEAVGAAASRYTEAKMAQRTLPFFELIDYVPWEKTETEEKEPLFIPTMFPLCLMGNYNSSGIAFGCVTLIPSYNVNDLYERLKWILDGKKGTGPIIKPKTNAKILSDDSDCLKLLTTGSASIKMEGRYTKNPKDFCVNITSTPPSSLFSLKGVLGKYEKEFENQDLGFIDLSTDVTNLEIRVMKQRNREKIYNDMIDKIEKKGILQANVSYKCNVVLHDGTVVMKSIDDMLYETYLMYTGVCERMLQDMINKGNDQLKELDLLLRIRPFLQKHMSIQKSQDEIISLISQDSQCDEKDVRNLFGKYRISKLLSLNPDINQIKSEIQSFEDNLAHITDFVIKRYNENIVKIQ